MRRCAWKILAGVVMPPDDVEQTVEEFLGDQPRAGHLRLLREALQRRLEGTRAALKHCDDPQERERLQKEIAAMERQAEALSREELITEFVEDSVRATASWSLMRPDDEEGES